MNGVVKLLMSLLVLINLVTLLEANEKEEESLGEELLSHEFEQNPDEAVNSEDISGISSLDEMDSDERTEKQVVNQTSVLAGPKNNEEFSWSISKAFWGLSGKKIPYNQSKRRKIQEKAKSREFFPMINRHHLFNRPPIGKVLTGSPNVNNPGFFSSSAHKPSFTGSGSPLPPNEFRGPSKKWSRPSFSNVVTPPHGYTRPPPKTTPRPKKWFKWFPWDDYW